MAADVPWTARSDGLAIAVRLTPKGGRDAIDGVERLADGSTVLKARVRAAPHEGAANDALARLIAKALAVPPSRVSLAAGATARVKTLHVAGEATALSAKLASLVGEAAS